MAVKRSKTAHDFATESAPPQRAPVVPYREPLVNDPNSPLIQRMALDDPASLPPGTAAAALQIAHLREESANPTKPLTAKAFRNTTAEVTLARCELKEYENIVPGMEKLGALAEKQYRTVYANPMTTPAHKRLQLAKLAENVHALAGKEIEKGTVKILERLTGDLLPWKAGLLDDPEAPAEVAMEAEMRQRLLAIPDGGKRMAVLWNNAAAMKAALRDPLNEIVGKADHDQYTERLAALDDPERWEALQTIQRADEAINRLSRQLNDNLGPYYKSDDAKALKEIEAELGG